MKTGGSAVNANYYDETNFYWDFVDGKFGLTDEDYVRILVKDFGHKLENAEFALNNAKKSKARIAAYKKLEGAGK